MRKFICIYTFSQITENFVLEGVFSKRDDAMALAKEISPAFKAEEVAPVIASGTGNGGIYIAVQTQNEIAQAITKALVGDLFEPLKKLAGIAD